MFWELDKIRKYDKDIKSPLESLTKEFIKLSRQRIGLLNWKNIGFRIVW